ncbi:MAG: asparagine synthase (glutamine-hydrolyzing), partial [Deltaproteobacteria bacterium]|nr:asparagine synthase (glutamine-hydrolyzing) [Deltaproteobacteria bacterium]
MCGILGWFGPNKYPIDKNRFQSALTVLRHRGPDDEGVYQDAHTLLGHVRLSVIDVAGGHQPWIDPDSGAVLVYNGELYNYLEERSILKKKGHRFRSQTDTEVLMKMYLEYGQPMLTRMNGMFAFALYDPRRKHLFCARDPLGIKPFYFVQDDQGFTFASEIKALVALGKQFIAEPKAIADYLALQYVMGEKTFFKNVFRLLPGSYLELDERNSLKKGTYWEIAPDESFSGTFEEAATQLRCHMKNSVQLQLRSDVPLGAHLSGGIDSATISYFAAKKIQPKKLHTFTAGFTEGGIYDDTEYARKSAEFLGTLHHVVYPTEQDFAELFPKLCWHLDEPMAAEGVFPQYIVSRLARNHVTVALGGQGADEILGGYARYYIFLLDQAIRNSNKNIGLTYDELNQSIGQLEQYQYLRSKLSGNTGSDPAELYWKLIDRSENVRPLLSEEFNRELEGYSPFDT